MTFPSDCFPLCGSREVFVLDTSLDPISEVVEASEIVVSPAILGQSDVQSALASLAVLAATDVNIASLSYNALTGVLTITETDSSTHTIVITDAELASTSAPVTTIAAPIPTEFYGTLNSKRLGEPDGWFFVNGKKVPYWD